MHRRIGDGMKTKDRASQRGRVRKTPATVTHDITLEVGSSILIDPAGEKLRIKEIKSGIITFEREKMDLVESG